MSSPLEAGLLVKFAVAMLAIVNPLGKVPIWLESAAGTSRAVSWRLAFLVVLTAGAILLAALLFGRSLLELFSLDLASFRIGGGIVILIVALNMVRGEVTEVDPEDGKGKGQDSMEAAQARFRQVVVPLAVPIIAGPGSITTAIVFSSRADSWLQRGALGLVVIAVMVAIYVMLLLSPMVKRVLGETVLLIVTRLFGLILAGIAVDLMATGLGDRFPALLR